jgi:DNA topoisomerase-1
MAVKSASKGKDEAEASLDARALAHARAVLDKGARSKWWRRCGSKQTGFWYVESRGDRIKSKEDLQRIESLVIPPGYLDVRVSPSPRSKLQAIAIDGAGRLQYRYHPRFCERQAGKKFSKVEEFGRMLPNLRKAVCEHLAEPGLGKSRVLALMVRLIGETYFRVGTEQSARRYKTYGITSLRNRHLCAIEGDQMLFRFVGKRHVPHERALANAELAAIMQEVKQLPGSRLFNYLDDQGGAHPVRPSDINRYVKQYMGLQFSCKDFRTWGGTLHAARALAEIGPADSERKQKRNMAAATRAVAEMLGNTPAVCRGSYIHPLVFDCYRRGKTIGNYLKKAQRFVRNHPDAYSVEEAALLRLMEDSKASQKR